ncbi:acyltransferase family protein [Alteromonas sp. 1_MG-2023]|uniref:acyltransferase family protein n=1 Tax=Alteromonas sp. 1_MG-2023 TaxID=3062669 RepID=UPI0026E23A68|nr:acyltransferase family protein [Alteromonas sp. 1_MG-2023]MDO6566278.1 acyltransferase family protein [Alteromonas sp. 1_MG-2023]
MTQVLNSGGLNSEERARYHSIDALRVIAFGVLILYHIGMYYVLEWGWHIKSDHPQAWLQDVMVLTSQWRMSLLFLISSMVLTVLLTRVGLRPILFFKRAGGLIAQRTQRLLIPLIFGMFVIVAPQVYIEWTVNGVIDTSFMQFYEGYINPNTQWLTERHSDIGLLTWNHLWFLPYLWVYSILLVLLFPLIAQVRKSSMGIAVFAFVTCTAMVAIWLLLRSKYPTTHDLLNDWYSHAKYFWVMVIGAVVILQPGLWQALERTRYVSVLVALCMYSLIIADRHDVLGPVGDWIAEFWWFKVIVGYIVVLNHWAWLAAILGFGKRYLNKPRAWVKYLNTAVLPYYIMHQTLIVMAAYYLHSVGLPISIQFVLILLVTLIGCALTFELVKRNAITRLLFGLKVQKAKIENERRFDSGSDSKSERTACAFYHEGHHEGATTISETKKAV